MKSTDSGYLRRLDRHIHGATNAPPRQELLACALWVVDGSSKPVPFMIRVKRLFGLMVGDIEWDGSDNRGLGELALLTLFTASKQGGGGGGEQEACAREGCGPRVPL